MKLREASMETIFKVIVVLMLFFSLLMINHLYSYEYEEVYLEEDYKGTKPKKVGGIN